MVSGGATTVTSLSLAPGQGMLVVDAANNRVSLLSLTISQHPGTLTVAVGATVTFSVAVTGGVNTGLSYAWTKSGVPVGTSAPTYNYTGVDDDAGELFAVAVTVFNGLGSVTSNNGTLIVQVRPVTQVLPKCVFKLPTPQSLPLSTQVTHVVTWNTCMAHAAI